MKPSMLSLIRGKLIVSCQALENEPLHSLFIMSKMAAAAAIRANSLLDVQKIMDTVDLPVIAEGNVERPERAANCLRPGAHEGVVGGAITRPQQITRRCVNVMTIPPA